MDDNNNDSNNNTTIYSYHSHNNYIDIDVDVNIHRLSIAERQQTPLKLPLTASNMDGMQRYLREWRQDALNKAQYDAAIFIGDKLLALTSMPVAVPSLLATGS